MGWVGSMCTLPLVGFAHQWVGLGWAEENGPISKSGTNRKIKGKRTKNKLRSMISPVRFHDHEGSPGVEEVLRWEGFVENVGFEPGVKE